MLGGDVGGWLDLAADLAGEDEQDFREYPLRPTPDEALKDAFRAFASSMPSVP